MSIKDYKLISLEINKAKEAFFLKKEEDKLVKHKFSKYSTLNISFSERKGIKFFDKLKNHLLPDLDTVSISGIGDSPSRFANFLTLNFPLRVNNFYAYGSGINLANYRISDVAHIFRQRIQRSVHLRDFEMSCYNLEQLLSFCSKMKDIDFSYCKLTDNEEILLDDDFDKLESLNLENIGLSKFNIESIIDYFIFKKIHYRMKYINVYHNNMDEYMEYLLQKLRKSGYLGDFKTMTDFARFMGFMSGVGESIGNFFSAIANFFLTVLYYIGYPIIYPYKKIFGRKAQ